MRDLITVCVICFVLSIGVDIFWLHGKYLTQFAHAAIAMIR